MTTIVAVAGSLRERSHTRVALRHALDAAAKRGAETDFLDLRAFDLPPVNPDVEDQGDSAAFTRRVRHADAILLGTPVYHGSYSGVLKNALDYCGRDEFGGATVGLLAVSGGAFPVSALDHLRVVCRTLDAWVVPHQAGIPRASSAFDDDGFADEQLAARVETLGRRVVEFAHIESRSE